MGQVTGFDLPTEIEESSLSVEALTADTTGVLTMEPNSDEPRNWVDSTRDWFCGKSHGTVEWLDTSFLEEDQEVVPTPPSRFRVGLYTQIDLEGAHSTIGVNPNRYRYRDRNRTILMAIIHTIIGFILLVLVSIPIAIPIPMPTFTNCGMRPFGREWRD